MGGEMGFLIEVKAIKGGFLIYKIQKRTKDQMGEKINSIFFYIFFSHNRTREFSFGTSLFRIPFFQSSSRQHSSKSIFKLSEELGADLIAAVSLDGPQHALVTIVLQQRLACLIKFPQPHPPRLLVVVVPLSQRFARDIVSTGNPRFVKTGVVDPATGRVHPARCNSSQDYVHRRDERDD